MGVSEKGNLIINGLGNGLIHAIELQQLSCPTNGKSNRKKKSNGMKKSILKGGHEWSVTCVKVLNDEMFVSGGLDGRVTVWEKMDGMFQVVYSMETDRKIDCLAVGLSDENLYNDGCLELSVYIGGALKKGACCSSEKRERVREGDIANFIVRLSTCSEVASTHQLKL
jgi:WD40 repeat protein